MNFDHRRRRLLKLVGAIALSHGLSACRVDTDLILSGRTMGTRYVLKPVSVPAGTDLRKLKRKIEELLDNTENQMSLHRADSQLSTLNFSAKGTWQPLSADTYRVIECGMQIAKASGGAYNPGAGPLVDYWGFGAKPGVTPPLDSPVPAELQNSVAENAFELKKYSIRKNQDEARLDLNAIAKGDAVDQIARLLEHWGILDFIVEIGGEFYARGAGPRGDGWLIGIEHPDGGIISRLRIEQQAVATSGDYIHYKNVTGARISHLIDPRTGKPVSDQLALVSVIDDLAMHADAWATAMMVMGLDEGLEFAERRNLAAFFLQRNGDRYNVFKTRRFKSIEMMI